MIRHHDHASQELDSRVELGTECLDRIHAGGAGDDFDISPNGERVRYVRKSGS